MRTEIIQQPIVVGGGRQPVSLEEVPPAGAATAPASDPERAAFGKMENVRLGLEFMAVRWTWAAVSVDAPSRPHSSICS